MDRWRLLLGVFALWALPTNAHAQTGDSPAQAADAASSGAQPASTVRIAVYTPVEFEILVELSSKSSKIGDTFPIRLTRPITVGDHDVVPAGTPGMGEVIQAAKAGWGGKAGELVVTVRYVEYLGVRIPLRRFRMGGSGTGENRVGTALAVGQIVSPLLIFAVSGGQKIIPPGARANAIVAADTEVPIAAASPDAAAASVPNSN